MPPFLHQLLTQLLGKEGKAQQAFRRMSTAFLVILWVGFAIWAYGDYRDTASAAATSLNQRRLAVELEFRGDLKPVQVYLLLANRWIGDHADRDPRRDATFAEMAHQFQAATRSSMICVVDRQGIATAVSPQGAHRPRNVAGEAYFQGAMSEAPGRIHLGKPYLDNEDQRWKLPIAFHLTQQTSAAAVLVVHVELAPLLATLRERASAMDGGIMMFRRDGVLLAEAPGESSRLGAAFAQQPLFREGLQAGQLQGLLKGQPLPGGEGWVAYGSTTEFPVVATVSQESQKIFSDWQAGCLAGFLLLLAVSAITCTLVRRSMALLSALEESRESLRVMAITDSLTGLFNRRHFYELAENEWERSLRYHRPLSLIIIDIDLFKLVNDTHGHGVGDEVLKQVASRCHAMLRDHDVMCRLGGEEFSILLPETSLEGAMQLAERLRLAVEASVTEVGQRRVVVTISAGVTQTNGDDEGFSTLERRADDALYRAKDTGRNRVCQG